MEKLHLNNNKLTELPASFQNLAKLAVLNTAQNELTSLPDFSKALTALYAQGNKVVIVPTSLSQLSELQILNLNDNLIAELPGGLEQLSKLKSVFLTANKLESLPENFEQLYNQLDHFEIRLNALSIEVEDHLIELLHEKFPAALKLPFENKLDLMYPNEHNKNSLLLKVLRFEATKDILLGDSGVKESRSYAISDFLTKTPDSSDFDKEKYIGAAKLFLDSILETDNKAEIDTEITTIASSLGACQNPVRGLLLSKYIANEVQVSNGTLSDGLKSIIERECLQLEITATIAELIPNTGVKIDVIYDVLDSIYLAGASLFRENPLRINTGNVRENFTIPSKSAFDPFGFSTNGLPEEFKEKFLLLCCQTEKQAETVVLKTSQVTLPTINDEPPVTRMQYHLDEQKMARIFNKHKFSCGIEDTLKPIINNLELQLRASRNYKELVGLHFDKDMSAYAIPKLQDELRDLLGHNNETDYEEVAIGFLANVETRLTDTLIDFEQIDRDNEIQLAEEQAANQEIQPDEEQHSIDRDNEIQLEKETLQLAEEQAANQEIQPEEEQHSVELAHPLAKLAEPALNRGSALNIGVSSSDPLPTRVANSGLKRNSAPNL